MYKHAVDGKVGPDKRLFISGDVCPIPILRFDADVELKFDILT
jgi:hypothetical protein